MSGESADDRTISSVHLAAEAIKAAKEAYHTAIPFKHLHVYSFCRETEAQAIRKECLSLPRTFRETDLFKLHQTIDLNNLDPSSSQAERLKALLKLKSDLYSPEFRLYLEQVTGCGSLTSRVDCSFNVYKKGCHLLCHDDAISTRKISYIYYLSESRPPEKKEGKREERWRAEEGGGLELYEAKEAEGLLFADENAKDVKISLPSHTPMKVLLPEFNSIVFFEVIPGRTFHAVQEVFSKKRCRCSIQGWFHAPTRAEGLDTRASLRLLQSPSLKVDKKVEMTEIDRTDFHDPNKVREGLRHLREYISRVYTMVPVLTQIREQFGETGDIMLSDFLDQELAQRISDLIIKADTADKLREMDPKPPPYDAGVGGGWKAVGPCFRQRYMRYEASVQGKHERRDMRVVKGESHKEEVGRVLEHIRKEVMGSQAFTRLLEWVTGIPAPVRWKGEVRRFRPGLDYTVGHYGGLVQEGEAMLDVCLCFVDETTTSTQLRSQRKAEEKDDNISAEQESDKRRRVENRWESDDYGGFQAFVTVLLHVTLCMYVFVRNVCTHTYV
ncbi:hypothetical protein AAMO2058_000565200 [Amorphochlora amoebiformis]